MRINPQQWPGPPTTRADVIDRENELKGNLSLNKELDFLLKVNGWIRKHPLPGKKPVTIRTIKMTPHTADNLRYSSKFNRSLEFTNELRDEGRAVARDWLSKWCGRMGESLSVRCGPSPAPTAIAPGRSDCAGARADRYLGMDLSKCRPRSTF